MRIDKRSATSKWPSGAHVANWQIRDGAVVVALDFAGFSDEALAALIGAALEEQAQRALK